MKTLVLALLLLHSPIGLLDKPSSNPADYPVTVHVVFSRFVAISNTLSAEVLQTVIDGQQVELQGENGTGVLVLGDYKAQHKQNRYAPKNTPSYEDHTTYRFLLPDGTIRDFDVVGLGPKA